MSVSCIRVEQILPHRHPFLFVDRILSLEHGQRVQGIFHVPEDHPFINRCSDDGPLLSPVLLLEALGQVAALCVRPQIWREPVPGTEPPPSGFLVRIDECSFGRPVFAGEEVVFSAQLIKNFDQLYKFSGTGELAGETVLKAMLTLYIDNQ